MKYGMRERISGAVILVALAVIFVPMLFEEPAPRDERPEPMLTIEQPIPVERRDVPDPQPPASLGEIASPTASEGDGPPDAGAAGAGDEVSAAMTEEASAGEAPKETPAVEEAASNETVPASGEDPIAELARAAAQRAERATEEAASAQTAAQGEWAVQVGSFGEPVNAERLEAQLKAQGYAAYRRERDNDLTTVYVGPFATSEEGERVMGKLKEAVNLQGLLVRVRD